MDKRVAELRERLWKKKAALQQKANLPVPTKSQALQPCGPSRVAAVGPYILSSTAAPGPPVPSRQELLIKPAYPDGTITLPMPDSSMKAPPRPLKPYPGKNVVFPPTGFQSSKTSQLSDWSSSRAESSGSHHGMSSTLPRMSSLSSQGSDAETLKDQKGRHISMFDAPAPVHSQNNPSSEDLLRDTQRCTCNTICRFDSLMAHILDLCLNSATSYPYQAPTFGKPPYSTGTFPGKAKPSASLHLCAPPPIHSHTLPLPPKQEAPPAATVRPFTPDPPEFHSGSACPPEATDGGCLLHLLHVHPTAQDRRGHSDTHAAQRSHGLLSLTIHSLSDNVWKTSHLRQWGAAVAPPGLHLGAGDFEVDQGGPGLASLAPESQWGQETERAPRPFSPTKLLPFISHPHRHPSDADLEALHRRLHHAPRPLKKRSSITEPEGPAGPNIQKLFYQKTTLAAMETGPTSPPWQESGLHSLFESSCFLPLLLFPGLNTYVNVFIFFQINWQQFLKTLFALSLLHMFQRRTSAGCMLGGLEMLNMFVKLTVSYRETGSLLNDNWLTTFHDRHSPTCHLNLVGLMVFILLLRLFHTLACACNFFPITLRLRKYFLLTFLDDPSLPNDEGITALHNAVCAWFLVPFFYLFPLLFSPSPLLLLLSPPTLPPYTLRYTQMGINILVCGSITIYWDDVRRRQFTQTYSERGIHVQESL
ncbi:unnamed protein product [Oncorhynchus mykiss]|uniref:Uncharacterized protein n=1 Tax=Oncorhynchus mykiss TaxID=8022 RepID=A0A060YHL5_ONCMY|nr:unnamed protein product [Oncorhynchus mykiss]